MGSFLVYTIYSGLVLLILYMLYRLFLSSEKLIVFNRGVLLFSYLVAFIWWPLSRFDWNRGSAAAFDHPIVELGELTMTGIASNQESPPVWPQIVMMIYLAGAIVVFVWTLCSVFRLMQFIRSGETIKKGEYTLVVIRGATVAPFSFGKYIVMSKADCELVGVTVAAHELAHIRCRHYLDLILAQSVCIVMWYNPASWLMRDELALIHEYQADAAVIDGGADPRSYQMLLIRKSVGNRFHTLANSLNHSKLKNRIAMMQKEKSGAMRRMRVVALALAPVLAVVVTNIPAIASGLRSLENVSFGLDSSEQASSTVIADASNMFERVDVSEISVTEAFASSEAFPMGSDKAEIPTVKADENGKDKVVFAPEVYAEFPGGMNELMRYLANNIRYPEKAREEQRQGRSIVQFDIETDGNISNVKIVKSAGEDLDEEAMRVVKSMPKWTPAQQDGKIVVSQFIIPVNFSLNSATEQEPKKSTNSLDEIKVVAVGTYKKDVSVASEEPLIYQGAIEYPKVEKSKDEAQHPDAIFVDGKLYKEDIIDIDPATIQSISVSKSDPEYPNGVIYIILKK